MLHGSCADWHRMCRSKKVRGDRLVILPPTLAPHIHTRINRITMQIYTTWLLRRLKANVQINESPWGQTRNTTHYPRTAHTHTQIHNMCTSTGIICKYMLHGSCADWKRMCRSKKVRGDRFVILPTTLAPDIRINRITMHKYTTWLLRRLKANVQINESPWG